MTFSNGFTENELKQGNLSVHVKNVYLKANVNLENGGVTASGSVGGIKAYATSALSFSAIVVPQEVRKLTVVWNNVEYDLGFSRYCDRGRLYTLTATLKKSPEEFWNDIVTHKIPKERVQKILSMKNPKEMAEFQKKVSEEIANKTLDQLIEEQLNETPNVFMLDDDYEQIKYVLADCCNPLPGDQVVGFQVADNKIIIHQTSCRHAIEQMSKFGNRIIKTKWRKGQNIAFLSGIRITGFDRKGMIKEIIDVVSSQMDLNIRMLNIESKNNVFTGTMMLYIQSVRALTDLIDKLKMIDQVEKVERI